MMNQGWIAVLCSAMIGCVGGDDSDEATNESEAAIAVSPQTVYTFSASSGTGVVIRLVDTVRTSARPAFTVKNPAGATVASGSGEDVAAASFSANATGIFSIAISDASSQPSPLTSFGLNIAVAPGSHTGGALSPGNVMPGHIDLGELDSYTFTASVGEGIVLRAADLAGGALVPAFNVYGPTGSLVNWTWGYDVASLAFAAPATGTYTVVLYDNSGGFAAAGDYNLYYVKAPGAHKGGALSPGNVVPAHLELGALDSYTFTASVGEGIVLRAADLAGGALVPAFNVYGPTGSLVNWTWGYDVASLAFAAPATGTYTVVLYDNSGGFAVTGDYKLYYVKAPGAHKGGALSPGNVVPAHLELGALDSYIFTASVGEGIVLRAGDLAGGALVPALNVYGPTGSLVNWAWGYDVASLAFSAPATGTYTVVLYDNSGGFAAAGDYNLYYVKAPGAHKGGALNAGDVVFEHVAKGELDSYTFAALTGDTIGVTVADIAAGGFVPAFNIYGPTGDFVTWTWAYDLAGLAFSAPASGTYTLVIYDNSGGFAATGDYRLDFKRTPKL